jgi:cell division protein FtsI (penicillin-binding protein 3)
MSREQRRPLRRGALVLGLVLGVLAVIGRAFQLQVLEGDAWAARAADQQRQRLVLPAPRGVIYDRNGVPLAATREAFRVAVAPAELADREQSVDRLRSALGISAAAARRATAPGRRWVVLPGAFDAVAKDALDGVQGIHFERVVERFYPQGELAVGLVGRVSAAGEALGGVELEFDSLLTGTPGVAVVRRDGRGRSVPGAMLTTITPVPGHDLFLTIDHDLQEIAHGALERAVEQTGATGGDLVLVDPGSGEVLAAVSRRSGGGSHWRAVTEPYEPGSTLKPFFVAALLAEGRTTLLDSVYAEGGRLVRDGRTVSDVKAHEWLTVRDALRYSSNVAMVKLSDRLTAGEQYGYLRDFGFGTPTGITYPSESGGLLRRPRHWSRYSKGSLAIGYEVSVTPLQMALAYGALAGSGVLMEPRLVREVRSREGQTLRRFPPRPVRRVLPPAVADTVAALLAEAVAGGTGQHAALGAFAVAGKTGTARLASGGRYEAGAYIASFAGFFPAEDPQLAFVVKLDRPKREYYGGLTAAPVIRSTLEAALAAWSTPIDRSALATAASGRAPPPNWEPELPAVGAPGPFLFALNAGPPRRFQPEGPPAERDVPAVAGLPLRDAVSRLHGDGFRVEIEGSGTVKETLPGAGLAAVPGSVVRVRASGGLR